MARQRMKARSRTVTDNVIEQSLRASWAIWSRIRRCTATHYNLAHVLAGDAEGVAAEHHFREAIKYAPEHFEAHLKLAEILCVRGERALAAPHLRKAAESPDIRVREARERVNARAVRAAASRDGPPG